MISTDKIIGSIEPLCLILLDDIECVIDHALIGLRFSNAVLQTILVFSHCDSKKIKLFMILFTFFLMIMILIDTYLNNY